ncbi:MAG TPA: alpha/beta hydrolase [Sphingomicrobium sp.]|nr:alpha/beta hydrolase [Sphingomicrobium sp.]
MREAGADDPQLMREALAGLRAYRDAPRPERRIAGQATARIGSASLRDHGGDGPPAILIPSLINPPDILDLDPESSLVGAIRAMGRRTYLVDWGPAADRNRLSVSGHIEQILMPLLKTVNRPAALVGYCLGGTMAIAAANVAPVEQVVTLATPWNFSDYPADGRAALDRLWRQSRNSAQSLGVLPMELLQAAFWSLDPRRTVRKFADFSRLPPEHAAAGRFVALEDWANDGEPLPFPAAEELIDGLFSQNLSGRGEWMIGGHAMTDAISAPILNLTASRDRIAPAATAPAGKTVAIASGHVGMIVGSAREQLYRQLAQTLDPSCR